MSQIVTLLDKVKKARSLASDNAFALDFGVKRQVVSQWRNGETYPSEDHIARLAELAGEDPVRWLVAVKAERTEGPAGKAWERLARQLGAAASVAFAFVSLMLVALPASAAAHGAAATHSWALWVGLAECAAVVHIMRSIRRIQARARLARLPGTAHKLSGERPTKKTAITRAKLEAMLATCDESLEGRRDRALLRFEIWPSLPP